MFNPPQLVNYVPRVPVAGDFSYRSGQWPVCVNSLNGDVYVMITGTAPYNSIVKVGTTETYTATIALGGQRVAVTDGTGGLIYADNTIAAHANQAVRITTQAELAGAQITVQSWGRITDPSFSWTPATPIYVSTNGLMTQTPPISPATFSKVIAVAETSTRLLMTNEPPLMLA